MLKTKKWIDIGKVKELTLQSKNIKFLPKRILNDIKNINSVVAGLSPYKPGKPIEELSRELGLTDIVKLASNENPLGASEHVKTALVSALDELTEYPDGSGFSEESSFRKTKVEPHQITLGNGSNDVLDLMLAPL